MEACVVCGAVEFYTECGFYFCQQCETQQEGRREEYVDYAHDTSTYVAKKRITKPRKTHNETKEESLGWTSWEAFNLILHGWTNELIMLGASPDLKITVIQLWATYLGKLQVAFRSFTSECLPRLSIAYRKKDGEILYGHQTSGKRKRKRRGSIATSDGESSTNASDLSFGRLLAQRKKKLVDSEYQKYLDSSASETDGASSANQSLQSIKSNGLQSKQRERPRVYLNAFARAEKKRIQMELKKVPIRKRAAAQNAKILKHRASAEHLTLPDILAVLILALRINNEKIHLSDMIRFQLEGHMSTRKLDHFFPDDEPLPKDFKHLFCGYSYEHLRRTASKLARLLEVEHIPEPNLMDLIRRYCRDLQLPDGIALYAERMIALSPPKLTFEKWNRELPRYEARAISVILIILKILFGLDGVTEFEISRVVSKINAIAEENDALDSKLFNFIEWQRYIECRRSVVMSQHSATKFRLDPESSCGNISEYLAYLRKFVTPGESVARPPNIQHLAEALDHNMDNLAENLPELEEPRNFEASLTPMYSYLEELKKDREMDLPSVLRQNFTCAKIGYMTNTETFRELAKECGIDLKIVDSSAQFLERIIPTAESERLSADIVKASAPTSVVVPKKQMRSDDPVEYLHLMKTGKIIIDRKKHALYTRRVAAQRARRKEEFDLDDFDFDKVRSNGTLDIVNIDDNDSDAESETRVFDEENMLLSEFEKRSLRDGTKSHWHRTQLQDGSSRNEEKPPTKKCDCIMCGDYGETDAKSGKSREKRRGASSREDEEQNGKDDVTILDDDDDDELTIVNEISNTSNSDNPEISIVSESANSRRGMETTFRPYKDYWLHRIGIRSGTRDSQLRWHLLERDLPPNLRWLLQECARMIELEPSVLYHELAAVEAYYADCLVGNYDQQRAEKFYDALSHRANRFVKTNAYKWVNVFGGEKPRGHRKQKSKKQ